MENCLDSPKLKVDVSRLVRGTVTEDDFEATLRLALTDEGLCLTESGDPFHLRLKLARLHGGIRVYGQVTGALSLECSRCLERFAFPVHLAVDEIYRLGMEAAGRQVVSEDDSYEVHEGILDLNPALNDTVMLAVPMKPLCRPDCRGLCPECGANLNAETCDCVTEEIDPRLEVLRRFLDREQG